MKNIVIFTNNQRSINVIKELKLKYSIKLIILSKKHLTKNLVNEINKLKIKIIYFENNIKNLISKISNEKPDFLICSGFPKKISKEIINLPKYCSINLHGGKVPNYLGGSTLNWQIINGEKKIFISSIKMNHKIDGGPLILQKGIIFKSSVNIDTVKNEMNQLFPALCLKSINYILKKKKLTYFKTSKKKFWKQRSKKDSEIKINIFSKTFAHNLIKASSIKDYPAFINFKKKKIFLYKSKILKTYSKSSQKCVIQRNKIIITFYDGTLLVNKFKIINK